MISVDEALTQLFALVHPLGSETVSLTKAAGRVLAQDAVARRDQPPFAGSAMDGYALQRADAHEGAVLTLRGAAAAGHRFNGAIAKGETVRIFTGAPVPEGADFVVIQEDVARVGESITIIRDPGDNPNIRPLGCDFRTGDRLSAPRLLGPSDIALLAAMNIAEVCVRRKPRIALLSNGDELVMPGESPGPDQIIASNTFGLKAMLDAAGAQARILPIARDTRASLRAAFGLAQDADLLVTIGGASVGDHDLVGRVAAELGVEQAFYKVKMRPGKPLMAGRWGNAAMVGLPGNPVSAMVCGHVFLKPMLRVMLGLGAAPAPRLVARLGCDLGSGGPREHYLRATVSEEVITPAETQDSGLLSVLAEANALMIRPADDRPRLSGDMIGYLPL